MHPNTPDSLTVRGNTARLHSIPGLRFTVSAAIAVLMAAGSASGISPKKQPLPEGYRQTVNVAETGARIAANLRSAPDPAKTAANTLLTSSGGMSAFLDREAIETLSRAGGGAGRIVAQSSPEVAALSFVTTQTGVFAIAHPDAELAAESTVPTPTGARISRSDSASGGSGSRTAGSCSTSTPTGPSAR